MRPNTFHWTIVCAMATTAVILVMRAVPDGPFRGAVILPFVLLLPGTALVRLLNLGIPLLELTLGIALSLALATLLAMVSLYAKAWSPDAVLTLLVEVTIAAVLFEHLIGLRRRLPSQPR